MRKFFKSYFLIFSLAVICVFLTTKVSQADQVYTVIIKKQEEKAKNRWSLSDWLATKDRMRWMEMWLALHSPSPYEFFLGTNVLIGNSAATGSNLGWDFHGAAYASIFGLELHRTTSPVPYWLGLFDLRVFGYHVQSTNLTLSGGFKSRSDSPTSALSTTLGASTTLYFGRYFGVLGDYHHFFRSGANARGQKFSGKKFYLEAFLEFKFLRFSGGYFREYETTDSAGTLASDVNSGALIGTKIFF